MNRILRPLQEMGAQVMGRHGGTLAPLAIRGGDLRGIDYAMPVASAQVTASQTSTSRGRVMEPERRR